MKNYSDSLIIVLKCVGIQWPKGLINAGWRGEKNAIAIVIMTIASRQGFNKNKGKKMN